LSKINRFVVAAWGLRCPRALHFDSTSVFLSFKLKNLSLKNNGMLAIKMLPKIIIGIHYYV